jgi:hypothetical protein
MTELDEIIQNPISRRTFLTRMSAAGLGAAAVALLAGCGGGTSHPDIRNTGGTTYADPTNFPGIAGSSENTVVLNYALTLETLEADLYRQAINIAAGKAASTPAPTNNDYSSYSLAVSAGGLSSTNAAVGFLYLQQYAGVEAAHRDFLKTALGSAAVSANAAGYTTGLAAGSDLKTILTLIRTVEETGVTAYLGAAGFLTDPTLVQVASTIYTTEARHSAAMNYVLGLDTGPSGAAGGAQPVAGTTNEFEYANTPKTVLAAVKPFFV